VHSLERTFHRCFLPSFSSFGWGFSDEKIKMWKVYGRRTSSDSKSSLWLWQGELKKSFVSHKTPQFYKNMNEITKLWKLLPAGRSKSAKFGKPRIIMNPAYIYYMFNLWLDCFLTVMDLIDIATSEIAISLCCCFFYITCRIEIKFYLLTYGLVIFALNILDSGVTSCNVIDQSMIYTLVSM
jgi:hypothetical protein